MNDSRRDETRPRLTAALIFLLSIAVTLSLPPLVNLNGRDGLALKVVLALVFSLLLAWLVKLLVAAKSHESRLEALVEECTAEIREREERLQLLGDNLPDSYVYQSDHEADGTPRFLYLSAGVEKLSGLKRQDILRDAGVLLRQIAPAQLLSLREAETASLRDMADFQIEFRMRRPDGEWRWLQVRARPRRKPDGQVVSDGVVMDVTLRKHAEETVLRERDFSAAILNSLPEIFFLYDQNLKLLRWNKNLERVTGYTGNELMGRSPLDFFDGDDRQRITERIREVFVDGAAEVEADLIAADGSRTPYFFTGIRVRVGERDCMLGLGLDIAERKQAQEALARQAAELKRRNEELERFNQATVGRELQMVELKRQINDLAQQLGRPAPYDLSLFEHNDESPRSEPKSRDGEPE